jgi:hypothetical protein
MSLMTGTAPATVYGGTEDERPVSMHAAPELVAASEF